MDFSYSEEQQLIQDSISKFIQTDYDFETRNGILKQPQGYSSDNWALFAELGWLAIPFAEEHGGLGGSAADLMIVMEEFGKGLVVEPFVPSVVMGGGLLAKLGNSEQLALLEQVIYGQQQLAFAFAEAKGRFNLHHVQTTAVAEGDGYILNGHKAVVLNSSADKAIVLARTSGSANDKDGLSLFVVDLNASGVKKLDYQTFDGHSGCELHFDNVQLPATTLLGARDQALPAVQAIINRAILALCAEAVGAMELMLQRTVEYSKTRKQFGVTLSVFQALQHRMAEMFIQQQQAKSIVMMAALKLDNSDDLTENTKAVSAAKAFVGQAGKLISQEAIQLHGGIGVTEELDVGHFAKRVTVIDQLFGNTDFHTRQFGQL